MNPVRMYRVTRRTREYVWLRNSVYGPIVPRGMSRRMTVQDFNQNYLPMPQQDARRLYFRRGAL